jgi:hypothetical protein
MTKALSLESFSKNRDKLGLCKLEEINWLKVLFSLGEDMLGILVWISFIVSSCLLVCVCMPMPCLCVASARAPWPRLG